MRRQSIDPMYSVRAERKEDENRWTGKSLVLDIFGRFLGVLPMGNTLVILEDATALSIL